MQEGYGLTDKEKVYKLVEILDMKKARNIIALDLMGATIIADYFVICTAGSQNQLRALFEACCDESVKAGFAPLRSEGIKNNDWALIDFDGVMVHIFSAQMRDFYALDSLWGEARKIEIETTDEI